MRVAALRAPLLALALLALALACACASASAGGGGGLPAPRFAPSFSVEFNETNSFLSWKWPTDGKWSYDAGGGGRELVHRDNGRGDRYCKSIHPASDTPCVRREIAAACTACAACAACAHRLPPRMPLTPPPAPPKNNNKCAAARTW